MYCTNCGNEIQNGMRFCIKCGARIQTDRPKNGSDNKDTFSVYQGETETSGKEKKSLAVFLVAALLLALLLVIIGVFVMISDRSRGTKSEDKSEQETKVSLTASGKKYEAGEWVQEGGRLRFRTSDENYLRDGWFWLDADLDRVAEVYHFDANGYLDTNTSIEDTSIEDDYGTIYVDSAGVARTFSGEHTGTMEIWTITMPDCPYTIKRTGKENGAWHGEFEYRLAKQNGYNDLKVFDVDFGTLNEYGNANVLHCVSPFRRYYSASSNGFTAKRELISSLDKGTYYEIPVEVIMDYSEDSLNFSITANIRFTKDCVILYDTEYGLEEDTLEYYLAQNYHKWLDVGMNIEWANSKGYATRIRTFSAD